MARGFKAVLPSIIERLLFFWYEDMIGSQRDMPKNTLDKYFKIVREPSLYLNYPNVGSQIEITSKVKRSQYYIRELRFESGQCAWRFKLNHITGTDTFDTGIQYWKYYS